MCQLSWEFDQNCTFKQNLKKKLKFSHCCILLGSRMAGSFQYSIDSNAVADLLRNGSGGTLNPSLISGETHAFEPSAVPSAIFAKGGDTPIPYVRKGTRNIIPGDGDGPSPLVGRRRKKKSRTRAMLNRVIGRGRRSRKKSGGRKKKKVVRRVQIRRVQRRGRKPTKTAGRKRRGRKRKPIRRKQLQQQYKLFQ